MKPEFLFAILLFLISEIGLTQQIIDIEADFIGIEYPNKLFFYKKNTDNSFYKTEIKPREISTYYLAELESHDELINMKDLRKINAKKLKKELRKSLFIETRKLQSTHNDTEYLRILKKQPNLLFKSVSFQATYQKNKKPDTLVWEYRNGHIFNYTLVRINKKHLIVMLISNQHNRIYGFIIPAQTSYIVSVSGDIIHGYAHQERKLQKTTHKTLDSLGFDKLASLNAPGFGILFKINEKHQLTDKVSEEVLLNKNFDTLYIKNGYIIGQHKDNITIYNNNIENITPKNLRAIRFPEGSPRSYYYCQVLTGNEIKWLDHSGALLDDYDINFCDYGGWTGSYNFVMIKRQNDTLYLDNKKISVEENYEKAWFLNKRQTLSGRYFDNVYENFLIVRKDYKYGLLKYEIDKEKDELSTVTILPVAYDFIYPEVFTYKNKQLIIENNKKFGLLILQKDGEVVSDTETQKLTLPIIYDDIKNSGKCQPFRLKKDRLYGYSGIQENPKYASLGLFNYFFARFTLPDGQRGWLDREGNEYLDQ